MATACDAPTARRSCSRSSRSAHSANTKLNRKLRHSETFSTSGTLTGREAVPGTSCCWVDRIRSRQIQPGYECPTHAGVSTVPVRVQAAWGTPLSGSRHSIKGALYLCPPASGAKRRP
jgi:hypothetical protein